MGKFAMSTTFEKRMTIRTTLEPMYRLVDLDGTIIDCNYKYARMLGYVKDEIVGMSILDHTPKKQQYIIQEIFKNWKNRIPVNNRKFPLLTKSGKVFDVLITVEGCSRSRWQTDPEPHHPAGLRGGQPAAGLGETEQVRESLRELAGHVQDGERRGRDSGLQSGLRQEAWIH